MNSSVIKKAKEAIKENFEKLEKMEKEKQELIQRYKMASENEKSEIEEKMKASEQCFKKLAEDTEKLRKKISNLKN